MHVRIGVGTGVGEDDDLVVAVVGVADGGEDDTAGADAGTVRGWVRSWRSARVKRSATALTAIMMAAMSCRS